jgi:ATP-binding cassette subfamily C protein PrsD
VGILLGDRNSNDPVTLGLRASAARLGGVAVFSGVVNLLMLSGSLYMLQVYDRVLPSRSVATLIGLSIIVVLAYLFQGYFDVVRTRMLTRIGALFDTALQEPIHQAIAALPLKGAGVALTQQPLRDLDQVRSFLTGIGPTAFLDMPWIPLFVLLLFAFHPLIGVTAVTGAAAIVGMTVFAQRQSHAAAAIAMECSARRQALADTTRSNAEVIRALGMANRLTARWVQANEHFLRENIRLSDMYAVLGSGSKVLRYVLQSSLLGIGAYLVVNEQASGGIMIASSIMMGRALAPIEVAISTSKQFVAARQSITRLRDILKATAVPEAPAVVLPRPSERLLVSDLSVMAPGTEEVIVSRVSFALDAGAGLAIVGASASGKSSLLRALVGVWPAANGSVRLDNASLDYWRPDELGSHLGYLPQDVELLDGNVAENICRFDTEATPDAILSAARIAGAHEMILRLPRGYSTRVGEGGKFLSAGQRQRIGLARAIFGKPFLVALDEPNANLDVDGENALAEAITTLRRQGCIVVVVSHRPSAVAALNMALVMYQGRSIAFGKSENILKNMAHPASDRQPSRERTKAVHVA